MNRDLLDESSPIHQPLLNLLLIQTLSPFVLLTNSFGAVIATTACRLRPNVIMGHKNIFSQSLCACAL